MAVSFNIVGLHSNQNGDYEDRLTLVLEYEQPGVNAAPSAIWFECKSVDGAQASSSGSVYDPQYHEIIYHWEFGDAANAVPHTPLNMPDVWKDTNTARGRRVAHCFADAGAYTVTCTAYEPATRRFGIQTVEVLVGNPDIVFPGGRTIVFDPNGDADVDHLINPNVQTTWTNVIAARTAQGLSNTARILFASGAVLTLNDGDPDITTDSWSNLRIGALDPDSPNRPIIASSGREGSGPNKSLIRDWENNCVETVLYSVDLLGEWDSTTETGRMVSPFSLYKAQQNSDTHLFLMHRANVSGFVSLWAQSNIPENSYAYAMYSDMAVTNWQNYGIISGIHNTPRVSTALVGVSSAQHVDALSGGPKNGLYNNHGSWRDFASVDAYASVCDFFSRTGWSTGGTLNGSSVPADQATIRINTSGNTDRASYLDRIASEGHIWYEEQGRTKVDPPGNHVIDKMLQVGGSRNNLFNMINVNYGGFTARNYFGIKLGLPEAGDSLRTRQFIGFNNSRGSTDNGPAGIRIYTSTGIDLRTDTQAFGEDVALARSTNLAFPVEILENNVFHEPNRTASTDVTDVFVDLGAAISGFDLRHKGPRFNFLHEEGTLVSNVSGSGGTFTVPYSQITDKLVDINNNDDGTPTDQAYWQANEGTDTLHRIIVNGQTYHADAGDFTVTFGTTDVTIQNDSTTDWLVGETWRLRLDRSTRLQSFDPQYDSTTQSLDVQIQATDANTSASADMGATAYDDFFGVERPASGNTQGAIL